MKRIGFVLKVRRELIEANKQQYERVWPDMLAVLRDCGWRNYSLVMGEDGVLFGYFETPESLQAAVTATENTDVNAR